MTLRAALRSWREIVGDDHVVTAQAALAQAEGATYPTSGRVPAIVMPADRTAVQACVRVAQAHHVAVYPVSRGCNWGYGSRVPPRDAVILDLRRMDRIVAFDAKLAYVTVEPGVTVRQLYEFLRRKRARLRISVSGSTPDASLVGNALERGLGNGVDFDRFANTCELEVVLPTGACVHTGFAGFAGARAAHTFPGSIGPALGGLFCQSNLGIVTRMTVWLWPEPGYREVVSLRVDGGRRFAALLDRLRELMLARALRSPVVFANDLRVMARHIQYPWEITGGRTPLPARLRTELRRDAELSRWNGSATVETANAAVARLERRVIRDALAATVDRFSVARDVGPTRVDTGTLQAVYWRKRTPPPARPDPDRDRCGVLWHNAMVPLHGEEVVRATGLAERIVRRHGFDPMLSVTVAWPRVAYVAALLAYDRDVEGEDGRAVACTRELAARFASRGWLPYRLGIHDMPFRHTRVDEQASLLGRLKRAVDPGGVLAPGRYVRSG
jgi:4-cresol dehydrogenase (hydroxylating)